MRKQNTEGRRPKESSRTLLVLGLSFCVLHYAFCIGFVGESRGEDVQWQSLNEAPPETPAATLAPPAALPPPPLLGAMPATPPLGGLLPVSYETTSAAAEPPHRAAAPEIIAVSTPVISSASPPPTESDEEPTEFASYHPIPAAAPSQRASGDIVQASATVPAPAVPEVPLVPGWEAPVDASWGAGVPTGPFPEVLDAPPGAANPLRPRLYVAGEYLLWWIQGQATPVLATTSSPSDSGILGAPTTQVLFGGNQINTSPYSGGRFTLGYWLDCDNTKAVEFTGFFLGSNAGGFVTSTATNAVIGRPFLEANNGQETAQLTSLPGVATGTLTVAAPSSLWGLEGNLRCLLCCGCNYRITALVGFRNINLTESLTMTEDVQGLATAPAPFTNEMITVNDRFATRNNFYGGQVGIDGRWYWGKWSVDARAKVALGDTVQLLDISGSQRFVSPSGVVQNFTGGLLALPSNIGHFSNNAFSVVPEIGLNLGYQILPCLRGFIGYNFLYWTNVIRPGTSIDRVLDVTQIPNFTLTPEPAPAAGRNPAPIFDQVGLWAQGLTFGLEFLY